MLTFTAFFNDYIARFLRFVLPPSRCLFCLEDAGKGTVCARCAEGIRSYSSQDCWSRQILDNGTLAIISLWPYRWPLFAAQHKCKFGRWWLGGTMLAVYAAAKLKQQEVDWEGFIVIPSPMHWRRRLKRGSNHAELQGRVLARELGLVFHSRLLKRVKYTPQQVGLSRRMRLVNLRRAFVADTGVTGKKVLLFDDIVTTGSTMRFMADALYAAGAELVVGVSLMRVD